MTEDQERIAKLMVSGTQFFCPIMEANCHDWDYIREICGSIEPCKPLGQDEDEAVNE